MSKTKQYTVDFQNISICLDFLLYWSESENSLYLHMHIFKKHNRLFFLLVGFLLVLTLQSTWIYQAYKMKHRDMMTDIKNAFDRAYQKEQTYRIPVVDIVNSGGVTIQSCTNEEITIVRKCNDSDTIRYTNLSGHSIENFLNRVFWDLRENITPLNIYCLADLFAGMLHDKNISVPFIIERYNLNTGKIIESSLLENEKQFKAKPNATILSEVSDEESLRVLLHITPSIVLGNISGILILSFIFIFCIFLCFYLLYRLKYPKQNNTDEQQIPHLKEITDNTFSVGKFHFIPDKNELQGFGETIQLNKKENAILYALCIQHGNIVERNVLLEENWGSSGVIYSRSLDTYLTTLRKYLKKDSSVQIVTIKGVGYKLVVEEFH